MSNSYKSFLAIGKTDYGSPTPRPPVAGCTAPASLPPQAARQWYSRSRLFIKRGRFNVGFCGGGGRAAAGNDASPLGSRPAAREGGEAAACQLSPHAAARRRSTGGAGAGGAVLCIVIRESPLSPFLLSSSAAICNWTFCCPSSRIALPLAFLALPYSRFPPSRYEVSNIAKYR